MRGRKGTKAVLMLLAVAGLVYLGSRLLPSGMDTGDVPAGDDGLVILSTSFPAFDFARAVAGEDARVRLLLPPGTESHHFEPTPQDIIAIEQADLLLTIGGESESWVEDMLRSFGGRAPKTLAMTDCVETLPEEHSESMESDEEGHGEPALDEHVWTSPKNARAIARRIAETLMIIDPEGAEGYDSRAEAYLAELDKLDQAFAKTVENGTRRKVIFGDRFPFRYLAHAYGLSYDAAFPGCSEDSEPSAQTLVSLIREIREEEIPVVFYIEFSSRKTADILAEETGAKPLFMHSCHNVSVEETGNGATYLSLMWGNVAALEEALR